MSDNIDSHPMEDSCQERRRSIVLYSPDPDFCMSCSMMFRDQFDIVTATDDGMILNLVQSLQPDVLVADARPTPRLSRTFEQLKKRIPGLRIVMLSASRLKESVQLRDLCRVVDVEYVKPIDFRELTACVRTFSLRN